MVTKIMTSKGMLLTFLTVSVILMTIFFIGKNETVSKLDKERVRNETLLSEKIKLDEKIAHMKIQISSLTGKNKELDKTLINQNNTLQNNEIEIKKLSNDKEKLSYLKKQNAELEALQRKMNDDIKQLNLLVENYKLETEKLNNLLAASKGESEALLVNNAILKAMVADNYRVEALKGKHEKLTVNSRRTNKLMVSFDLPVEETTGIYFKVIDPSGKEYSSLSNKSISYNFYENNDVLLASINNISENIGTKRAEMTFKPETKLQKGIYKILVYNNNDYMGSTQLRLK